MRILVTGGAGFIGSHYVRTMLTNGYGGVKKVCVTVLDKLTYAGSMASLESVSDSPHLRFVQGDICDATLLETVVPGHDVVVNFAAETHVDRSIDADAEVFAKTNVVGTQILLQACLDAGTPRVIQVSTDEVYGSVAVGSWREDAPLSPNSPYAATKAGADLLALAYARTHGLNVSITRSCNNYGPYQAPEKLIPLFVTNLLDGHPVPLYGDGSNIRSWVHVDDHCRGIQLAVECGQRGAIYHIGGNAEFSNIQLTRMLLQACGAGWEMVRHVEDRRAHDFRYALNDLALRGLGYTPVKSFAESIELTINWYRDNRAWWEMMKKKSLPRCEPAGLALTNDT